jgi:hypothetical protein
MSRRLLLSLFFLTSCAWAADIRNELPAPINFTAVVLDKTITLTWQWPAPEELPVFTEFGYEVKRSDGKTFRAKDLTYVDSNLAPGAYSYTVRVRGDSKEKGKKVTYVSDWSEAAAGTVSLSCSRAPTVELTVEPTQKTYSSIPSLRFHMKGSVAMDSGCTLISVHYHLDTGTGITHSAPLTLDAHGHFDTFVNALGPEDEIPTGRASFAITVTAADEAGPATSDAFTLDVDLQNPFAPH